MDMIDPRYMHLAIDLAKKGAGYTSPNPLVGAVLVKDGTVIGRGYHARYGEFHAERNALSDCAAQGKNPAGATMYVTLEPCCHYGKQAPCTDAIIAAKITRVVVGSADPNPLVSGKGCAKLRAAGIEVIEGFLKEYCDPLNKIFFYFIKNKLPYIACKYAMTLDGKIATKSGKSKWISGKSAREFVHHLRTQYTAIMIGSETAIIDNPELSSHGAGRNPVRIICDTNLRTPLESTLVKTAGEIKTIFATATNDTKRIASFEQRGCEVLPVPQAADQLDLQELLKLLAAQNIDSILVEGGGTLHYSLFKAALVQKLYAFIAAKIFGGVNAKTPVEGDGIDNVEDAFRLQDICVQKLGDDFLLEGDIIPVSK